MAGGVASPRFVGRSAELGRLEAAFARASSGAPVTVCVGGEAGVGKTRLVSEFAARVRRSGGRVLLGGCIELGEGALPFAPVAEALRGLGRELEPAALDELTGPGRPMLARLLPELGQVPAEPMPVAGDPVRAIALTREALAHIDPGGDPVQAGLLHGRLGSYLQATGGQGAMAEYEQAAALVPASPPSAERAGVLAEFGEALMIQARHRDSRALCEEAIAIAGQVGAPVEESRARRALTALSGVLEAFGRLEEAAAVALEGSQVAGRQGLARWHGPFLAARLRARTSAGTANPAAALPPRVEAEAITGEAELARLQGRNDAELWGVGSQILGLLGEPHPAAYAHWRQAESLLMAGAARDRAEQALRGAHTTAVRLGAHPLRTEIEALARRGRLDLGDDRSAPVPGQPSPLDALGLTPREREVLALVAAGRTNRQIAEALFISPKTATVHVSNILGKLGAHTRVEAAAIAHRLGIDEPLSRSRP